MKTWAAAGQNSADNRESLVASSFRVESADDRSRLPRKIVSRTATSTDPLPRSKPEVTAPRISVFSKRIREPSVVVPSARTSVNGWFAGLISVMVQFRTVRFAPVQQKSEVCAAFRSLRFTIM
ncbi:MAG: hypothetical protein ACLQIB_05105, partial [Isosphaeraceae bacterium]